jgi:hypothetical protein
VDFANHGAAFVAGDFHKSSDTPFVRDFVTHVGCDHTEVVLDSRDLADRDLNRAKRHSRQYRVLARGRDVRFHGEYWRVTGPADRPRDRRPGTRPDEAPIPTGMSATGGTRHNPEKGGFSLWHWAAEQWPWPQTTQFELW